MTTTPYSTQKHVQYNQYIASYYMRLDEMTWDRITVPLLHLLPSFPPFTSFVSSNVPSSSSTLQPLTLSILLFSQTPNVAHDLHIAHVEYRKAQDGEVNVLVVSVPTAEVFAFDFLFQERRLGEV